MPVAICAIFSAARILSSVAFTSLETVALVVYVMVTTYEASNVLCSQNSNIWVYCLSFICCGSALGVSTSLIQMISVWLTLLSPVFYAFMAIWGTMLWSFMDEPCFLTSNKDFWSLILLFKIYVVLGYVALVLSFFTSVMQIRASFEVSDKGSAATESSPLVSKN